MLRLVICRETTQLFPVTESPPVIIATDTPTSALDPTQVGWSPHTDKRKWIKRAFDTAVKFYNTVTERGGQVIGKYVDSGTPIECRCEKGHTWKPTPYSITTMGYWCRVCAGTCPKASGDKFRTTVTSRGGRVIGKYVDNRTPVDCICGKGHLWTPIPYNIISGSRWCRVCAGMCPKAAEDKFRIIVTNKGGQVTGKYVNVKTPVECICEKGHTWSPQPSDVTSGGTWCLVCSGHCPKATEERFRTKVISKGGQVVGQYVNTQTPVECVCERGHLWKPRPNDITSGEKWCSTCRQSHGEALLQWLSEQSGLKSEAQVRLLEYPQRSYDRLIYHTTEIYMEHDGEQHFDEDNYYNTKKENGFVILRQRDIEKTKLVIENYKRRMIRTTYNILKCDREEVKRVWNIALQRQDPLLYIDAFEDEKGWFPFLDANAEIYNWLTSQVVLPGPVEMPKIRLNIITSPPLIANDGVIGPPCPVKPPSATVCE